MGNSGPHAADRLTLAVVLTVASTFLVLAGALPAEAQLAFSAPRSLAFAPGVTQEAVGLAMTPRDPMIPVATLQLSAEPDLGEWYRTSPLISLYPDPDYPLSQMLLYRVNGGPFLPYVGPFFVIGDGPHTVQYYQYDDLMQEQINDTTIWIDSTPPLAPTVTATTISSSEIDVALSNVNDVEVPFYSGFDHIEIWVDGQLTGFWTVLGVGFGGLEPSSTHTYKARTVDMAGNVGEFSAEVSATTLARSIPTVPSGTNVHIDLGEVGLTFDRVIVAGDAFATPLAPRRSPVANFRILPSLYYDIHPTAVFTGQATVTLHVPSDVNVDFARLKLFHWKNNAWEDVTVSVDPSARTITGRTDSFSDFSIQEASAPVVSTPASSAWSLMLIVVAGSTLLLVQRRRVE